MGGKRRGFTREFKLEAVRLVSEGHESVTAVAGRLGIRADMLRNWKRQVESAPGPFRQCIKGAERPVNPVPVGGLTHPDDPSGT